ncbi:hypothetical protein WP3W19E03_18650 [Aeromonas veronii]|uniref:Uncharacterized protein n=1 Tax=Aeromonas veronii TaxID=654 RepID=A0A6S5BUZ1_AERVE|nr:MULTISPECIES: hypothetical protein [Aeromonas]BBR39340.1 hypothetical protein WP3W19E03_18650 [Aeromonas veronii]
MTSFYKTTDAKVLAAHAAFEAAKSALIEKANILGKEFDGKPKFSSDVHQFKCDLGVVTIEPKQQPLQS